MNYHNITKCDMLNGEGLRVVLWLSHCEHACTGCHNPQTWSKNSGILFDKKAKEELFEEISKDYISGVTFSGGDPLSKINRTEVMDLIKEIKKKFPNKTIWVYTGYLKSDVDMLDGFENIDVLIDGKYEADLSIPSPQWRGSSNQIIWRKGINY